MAIHRAEEFPHVVRNPAVLRGEPSIVGTRIPVWVVVAAWRMERDVASILRAYPALTPALVQEALAFAAAHPQEIEAALVDNEVELV